ncbi:unnamed protein product [marine sediment metagenome]|uniref:Uncharacterized protein n=1 Tax=marine sediment metagenome TaxID=412755 RepID=X1R7X1_9ZZZZ
MWLQWICSKIPFDLSIIKVENLSRKYGISRQKEKASYGTSGDELDNIFEKTSPMAKRRKGP